MLLTALDPDVMFFDNDDCRLGSRCFDERLTALFLHRDCVAAFDLRIAVSDEYLGQLWAAPTEKQKPRDLMMFYYDFLSRYQRVVTPVPTEAATIDPGHAVCHYYRDGAISAAFERLLGCCAAVTANEGLGFQIGTWPSQVIAQDGMESVVIAVASDGEPVRQATAHLVWSESRWAAQLNRIDWWWPDLQKLVDLHYRTDPGLQAVEGQYEEPLSFSWTDGFRASLEEFCRDPALRRSLVEATTKLVHGILDAALGDEQIRDFRRFRVTRFWRVHYRRLGDEIVLDQFGPHDRGL